MSCVDAAIIKALVEHIGMDPDSVGSSNGSSVINATWGTGTIPETSYTCRTFTLPAGESIKLGTCLKLYNKDKEQVDYFYCTSIQIESDVVLYAFYGLNCDSSFTLARNNNIYYCNGLSISIYADVPDNNTTGVFNLGGEVLSTAVAHLLAKALE